MGGGPGFMNAAVVMDSRSTDPVVRGDDIFMRDTRTIIVLSAVTLLLVAGIGILIFLNPYTALGLAPVLLAVAAIVRALAGNTDGPTGTSRKRTR